MPPKTLRTGKIDGERLKAAMDARKLSPEFVAKKAGVPIKSLYGYLEGDVERPRGTIVRRLAEAVQMTEPQLLYGELPSKGFVRAGRIVPMIAVHDAIAMPASYNAQEYVHTHFGCSGKAFAIEVFDTRNAPEFQREQRLIIDPAEQPQPGDMVLAFIDGDPIFGKYTRKNGVEIQALNTDWDARQVNTSRGDRVVGVMTEHARPRRSQ
jgi:transcriptional regulator with XRE-family HTH domain